MSWSDRREIALQQLPNSGRDLGWDAPAEDLTPARLSESKKLSGDTYMVRLTSTGRPRTISDTFSKHVPSG